MLAAAAPLRKKPRTDGHAAPQRPLVRVRLPAPPLRHAVEEIPRGQELGLERFLLHHLGSRTPVVVRGACARWPAVACWDSEDFWSKGAIGQRFVPVEADYWFHGGCKIMTLHDFVEHCFAVEWLDKPLPGFSGGGYLAQHALLDQLPALEPDVVTPDMALCGPDGFLSRKVFFGPKGTVTPLHYDPHENAFCQVAGAKYVRLYAPSESPRLYARDGSDPLRNNSRVEPADLLEGEASGAYARGDGRFGEVSAARYTEAVLEPGDLMYLPQGWWHYVKSLSTSISVAFHFS